MAMRDIRATRCAAALPSSAGSGAAAPPRREPPGKRRADASRVLGYSLVLARWTTPDGQTRTGRIPVSTRLAAGHTAPLWVNAAGSPTGSPLNHRLIVVGEATAAAVTTRRTGHHLAVPGVGRATHAGPAPACSVGSGHGRCRSPVDQAVPVAGLAVASRHITARR